jgi:nucleotide-binding universal stress UspA family protein
MTIVLATDGKPHTQGAVDYAFKYARLFSEPLYIVSVITSKMETDMDLILERTHALFETLKSKAQEEGIDLHPLLEYGPPAENVMALAERVKASVIIVGTSEKSALDRVILGSVSDHIVRNARSTVIVVR